MYDEGSGAAADALTALIGKEGMALARICAVAGPALRRVASESGIMFLIALKGYDTLVFLT